MCLLGFALLFRGQPVALDLFGAAAFLNIYLSLPKAVAPPLRVRMGNIALLVLSVCLSLVLGEFILRIAIVPEQVSYGFHQADPEYIFLLGPGSRMVNNVRISPTGTKAVVHHVSVQGFRDRVYGPKAAHEFRILMLGDSFLEGNAVAAKDSIPKVTERMLAEATPSCNVSVINGGCPAAGPVQELGALRKRGLALDPDLVMLAIYPANDIEDCLEFQGRRFRAFIPEWHRDLISWRA